LFTALDYLIAEHWVPVMIAISIGNGSGDAQGSERGLEYDTMSGLYAEFVEKEVLPLVEKKCSVKLTRIPTGGPRQAAAQEERPRWRWPVSHESLPPCSDLTRNVRGTSRWQRTNSETPHGAWEFARNTSFPTGLKKPLRIWMHVSDQDILITRDNYHDWVVANERMAKALAAKGYPYQFVFAKERSTTATAALRHRLCPWHWSMYGRNTRRRSEPA